MDDKQLQSLQEQLAKDKQNRLASGFDPYAKPLFAQFGGLTGSISENIEPMSFEKTWDEQAQFDKEYLGLRTLKAFDDLKFDVVDDTGSSFNRGRSAVQYGTQMSSMGWGERNPLAERYRMNIAKAKADDFILPSGEIGTLDDTLKGASNWFGGLKEGFEKWFRETETEKGYKALRERLEEVDPAWDAVKKYESLDNWRKNNSEAFDFIERAGINISNYVEPSRNEAGFNVAVYEAAKDAIVAHRMRLWNDSSRYIAKTYAEVVEGFKDPLLARDIITTTVLTAGLAAPQLIGARVGGTAMQAAARTSAGLLNYTGPMTGFVEGLVYPTLQASVLRGAGRSGLQTFTARALSMFAEGTTQGVLSALESQRDEYEWRNLLFHDADKLEKYDFGDTLKIGLTTGAASAAFLGAMRFGLGALGEWKYYRKGDWKNLGRSWANSLDNWAQTKEGLTVFGETLSDGRGILLGNKLDKYMAKHDGRNFTNVMLNGSRLFGKMDPTIAAKINLDTKEAIKVIDAFEEATGIAGEAAMRGVDGVDAETKGLFLASLDQDYLKKLGLNYDDVTTVFKEFKNAKDKNLIGPLERSAVSRGLENVASVRKLNDTRTMFRMVEVKAIDKNLAEAGIKSADVLELAEDALEKSVNLLDAQDWSNFRLAAVFAADARLEDNLASRLSSIFSKDETILADGKPIPREVVAPLFRQALKIEEGRKDFIYLTNGGEDNKATFVLMIDPETGEVLKTKRKLVRDDKGNLNVEFEASKNPSYKPENIRSVKEFNEGLHSAIEKANEFFKEEKKAKTRKKIDGVKNPEKKEALEKTFEEMFNEGLDPTIDNIRKIFGKDKMSVSQATVANIIMRSLGYDPEDRLIKIANGSVAETASGNIVLLGTNAIINATKASDLGTLTHEMSHYVRHIFGNETDFAKEARTALGIDESLWSKFKDWCGVEGDNWTVAAEEKFARGFAFYIKSIMEGKGKAPVTSVQRLFHILGDHIGDIGQKFKSEGELGFEMTPVAEEVFEKLFLRSNDNISELFDVAYHKIFRNLPKERREEIGAAVLGEMAWNDYKAKTQKSIAERRMKTDPVIAGSSIPRESTSAVVDRISASVSGSASKKLIKAAIKAGLPMDKVVEYINNTLTMFAEKAYTQVGLGPTDKVLKTSKIDEVPTDVLEKLVFDEKNTAYVATDLEFVFADGTIKPVVSVTSITKNQADRELRNRRLRGTKPPISVPDKVAEMTDAVSEVTTKTGFVDKDGVSVDLSPTEAVVATVKNIEAKETEVAAARTELIADKLETMTLDKVDDVAATTEEAKDAQLKEIKEKNPELAKELDSEDVNVEFTARPTQVSVTVTRLKRVSDSSSRVVQEIASDKDKEQLTVVAETLIASPSRYDELVSIWENYGKDIALPRPLREYLLAEVKKIIARDTLDKMIGLSDLELERFVDIKEKIDLIDSELGSKELEAFIREPNAETTKALSLVSGISEEDLQLYSRGNFHLVNQLHVVEFRTASEFIKIHKDSHDRNVEFLKNNKAAYENANIKETKTPEEKELIKKYNGIKATVSRYDNSVKRVSMGLLGEEVVSVGSLKAIETGMIFDISKGDTYKRIIEIFVGKDYEIGIDDLIAEFSKSPSTVESIGKKLGLSPEESLGGFKAWAAGENEYNGTPFTADALTVTRKYVRGIIRTLNDKTKTGERTHKGVIGLYVKSSSGDESAVDVARNLRESKTSEHIKINNESQIMQFTASVFYDELVRSGETKLAEYFAARRATYWLPGDRLENLVDSYNKRGVDGSQLTKSKIDTLERKLKEKIDEFATRLRLSGLNDAATTVTDAQFNLSMVKPVVLNQSSTEAAIKSLGELIEKSYVSFDRPVKVDRSIIREIELNRIRRDFSDDLYKLNDRIMDGRVRDAKQLLEGVAAYNNAYTDIAKKLLENKNTRELLENVTVMPSIHWSAGAFHPGLNMITLNPFDIPNERVIVHEIIHATTKYWFDQDLVRYSGIVGTKLIGELEGAEYIKALRKIVDQDSNKITEPTRDLITLYLKVLDSMNLPDSLKELVNNRNAFLVNTEITRTLYGLYNLDEFLSESTSNPAFIKILIQIEGDKPHLISHLLEPVFAFTGLEKTPETIKLAAGSILNNTLLQTVMVSRSFWARDASKTLNDILSLMKNDPRKQEFRIDRSTGYLSSLASFRHMGIDPKSKSLIFNQSLIDPAVKEELKLRRDLKASKGRLFEQYKVLNQVMILDQKRAEKALSDRIEKAKALGEDTKKLEKELSELVDSAAVRRRNLLEKGFSEEMEPEDIDIIKSMIEGKMPLSGTTGDLMMSRYGSPSTAVSVAAAAAKFKGKAYRDLDKKERMEFVLDVLMPKISEVMGKRNTSAGVFSAASDSVVGKKVNSLIGGGAAYGDTADSSSMGLQFLSKILDPTMDLRDGEIGGVFELFSVDKLNAELNNSYSRSGLLAVKNKMLSRLSSEEDIRSVVHTAWNLLAEPEDSLKTKLESVNNKDLVLDLIKATNKFNEYRADLMMKYGNLKMVDPSKYGTRHRVNNLAFSDQQGFVKALTDNAINKTLDNGELSVITAEALGWLKIRRETGATDSIVSIEVVKDSPIKLKPGFYDWNGETRKLFGKTETDKDGNKITAISRLLDSSNIDKHNKALYSNEDYIPAFKRLYESRGTEYTAIRQSMTIAKDRYLGIVDGDTKTGKPRSESIGRGMDYNEERILSHAEITANPELSKYFRKNIFDLIHDDLRGQLTDLLMKKYISDFFGVKMSWSDLVEILKDYGEESQDKANMSMSEIESRRRGYDRMHDIWEQNIGYSIRVKDSVDRHYNRLITDSRIPVLLFGGIRAAASSLPEIGRAIIASNHNKNKLVQVVPNFIKMLTLFSKNKRDTIKEVASATHWLRGLSSDHLLARSEVSPENPFGGTMLGSRKGGFFKRFAEDWREVSDLNKTESSIVGKTLNRASLFATRLGTPLAWVNDVTTTLHVWNAQTNLTKNSSKFLQLADKLSKKKPTNLGDFAILAKECGLTAKEAVDLSSAGLLNPSKIKVMIEAAKDQKNYTDGLLDVQKLFIWAGDDQVKIDAINAMGAYINTTSRQTNTEPTLLDLRINQSAFAKSMAVFMQFLLSHSVQEIGRRRRYSTADYGKHLAGLVIMEAVTYSLARQKPDEDKWIWEEARENPIDTIIRISTGMPMLGSYQMWGPVLRMILKGGTNLLTGEDENERLRLPDLYQAPAENLPNKGLEILKSAFEVAF